VRVTITKRIPVAAGMGGGSADAAATLRLAARAAGRGEDRLPALAAGLGSDVPGLLRPARVLATGAGEQVRWLDPPPAHGLLVLPSRERLSTGDVYAEADRLGLTRGAAELAEALAAVKAGRVAPANDLQDAARSLCSSIDEALAAARDAGALDAIVSGSGPTVVGLFRTEADATAAAEELAGRDPAPILVRPLSAAR
jgi:4-diphosphocytidyl-2-C-methyl-D-erythritol kinase